MPNAVKTSHLDLVLTADFEEKVLFGSATFQIINDDSKVLVLDTIDLIISKVYSNVQANISFTLSKSKKFLGQALEIPIDSKTSSVTIEYKTSKNADALLWIDTEQTTDKQYPFLFTQGQAILSRSWIPCQDSPGVRITYSAEIHVPKGMLALMSATNPQEVNENGVYRFEMKQAIPPYLIALAIGGIKFGKIGPRTGVYAEPSLLKEALFEFEDMEKMLITAEELYGPYLWEQFDVLVLPSSFPFGGMENPKLTFATPTIIAGDKSLTSLIAHELAHSWSGNLVTNATWNELWINEGFTVYFERRIMEALYGQDYANMLCLLGYQDLLKTVDDLGHAHRDTHLLLDLKGRNPDDAMTDIAYEKGYFFLVMLEHEFGREKFDAFVMKYFDDHKFQSMATEPFVEYLNKELLSQTRKSIDIDAWIYQPGIPETINIPKSNKFDLVDIEVQAFLNNNALKKHAWSTHEWLYFVRSIPDATSIDLMKVADVYYNFSESGNSEIAAVWYEKSIITGYAKYNIQNIKAFLIKVGRRKFLTPLYRAMFENDMKDKANEIYIEARPNYHAISTKTIDALLNFNQ